MLRITREIAKEFDDLVAEIERLCDRRTPDAMKGIVRATQIAEATGDVRQLTLINYLNAYYDCFINNDYEKAIKRLTHSLAILNPDDYNEISYRLLMALGNSYHFKGDLFSAQESYLKGLRTLEARATLNEAEEVFLASFYYNLSVLLSSSELKIDAEEYLQKAIALFKKGNKTFQLSNCYVAYGQLFEQRGELGNAVNYLKEALLLVQKTNEPYTIAVVKANLGLLLVKIHETEKSFEYLHDALAIFEKSNTLFEYGMVKFELAQAYTFTGELEQALINIDEAEKIMLSLNNKKELADIFKFKSSILTRQGNHVVANQYLEKYIESLKLFFDNEKNNALTRAKKEFETELKEKETNLLREKNEEIQEYVQKLEISNNELKQFAHVASHDLREPLRMITGYISLLRKTMKDKTSEQEAEFFGYVQDGARRMDQLIQDLLRLAKVDANPIISKLKLNFVIEEIKLNLDALIKEKGATINVGHLPVIMADRAQMIQLFQNLIANGIKYNRSDKPTIAINCEEKKDTIEIVVTDNGIGIPKHLRDEAFQIFKRLHKQSDVNGSGIGLAICKKIVESMGGKIHIEDAADNGTVFKITLQHNLVATA